MACLGGGRQGRRCCTSARVMLLLFWSDSDSCRGSRSSLYGLPCRSAAAYGLDSGCSRAVPCEPAQSSSSQHPPKHSNRQHLPLCSAMGIAHLECRHRQTL